MNNNKKKCKIFGRNIAETARSSRTSGTVGLRCRCWRDIWIIYTTFTLGARGVVQQLIQKKRASTSGEIAGVCVNFATGCSPEEFCSYLFRRIADHETTWADRAIVRFGHVAAEGLGVKIESQGRLLTFVTCQGGVLVSKPRATLSENRVSFVHIRRWISIVAKQVTSGLYPITFAPSSRSHPLCIPTNPRGAFVHISIQSCILFAGRLEWWIVSISWNCLCAIEGLTPIFAQSAKIDGGAITAVRLIQCKLKNFAVFGVCRKKGPKSTIKINPCQPFLEVHSLGL